MKIQKIVCDRCGTEIINNPVCILPHIVDRDTGSITFGTVLQGWDEELQNYDFCEECTEEIMQFAKKRPEGFEKDAVIQIKVPTEEELAGIQKAMKNMPPRVAMVDHKEPTIEMVTAEPKQAVTDAEKPKAKSTVQELILQGVSKKEVMELTGCKGSSYDQIKYTL